MIPELGLFALVLAFGLCVLLSFLGLAGAAAAKTRWMAALPSLVAGQ